MNLDAALYHLAREPNADFDLAELALALARDEYPDLDEEGYLSELDAMAHEIRPRLRGSPSDRLRCLSRYLFHEMGFHGNERDYYDPRNSYFNDVLDRRVGLPITLSILAMAIGCRAGLHVVGVGLPGHFVSKLVEDDEEILFDPFNEGKRLTPAACARMVQEITGSPFEATPDALRPTPPGAIVLRMLTNLKGAYLRVRDFPRAVRVIERLRQLSPDDAMQVRDLGVCLLQAHRPGRAIDPLDRYLQQVPDAPDAASIRQMLRQARTEVARWN